jgi:hypothetical protein
MEKILLVTDALKFNETSMDIATFLCDLTNAKLTAVFLENTELEARPIHVIQEAALIAGTTQDVTVSTARELKADCCNKNIERFREACKTRRIEGAVHRGRGVPQDEVVSESRYADLLLTDVRTSFSSINHSLPSNFVKDILADAECPVVVLPDSFSGIEQLVFTFDGHPSSVYAIKQFTYLFPALHHLPVTVVSINNESLEERYKLKEWLHMHYREVTFEFSEGSARVGLLAALLKRTHAFIVMGAYGRSAFSNLFNPSHATAILQTINQPVFIAHH